ncbi:MAG: hypothetical protein M0011_13325 [Elusimicrobia bacterium]|nr:hypothetical protein [Elusimicrobiota bacterium]
MTGIAEAARKGLSGNTGFSAPEVLGVRGDGELYFVTVRVTEAVPGGAGLSRSYEVAVDAAGEMHGYRPLRQGVDTLPF